MNFTSAHSVKTISKPLFVSMLVVITFAYVLIHRGTTSNLRANDQISIKKPSSSNLPLKDTGHQPLLAFRSLRTKSDVIHHAKNEFHQMEITCDHNGLTIMPMAEHPEKSNSWSFCLANNRSSAVQPQSEASKVIFQNSPSEREWFINSEKGIEHGMTLSAAPSTQNQPLTFEFKVTSELRGTLVAENHLVFKNSNETPVLRYEKLFAFDAQGKNIPTALAWNADTSTISWRIDHQLFQYPITIDPIIATFAQTLLPPSLISGSFGDAIAIVDDFMAVGIPDSNRVYLYERIAGTWTLFSRKNFISSPATNGGAFGGQVLMPDLNTLIISDSSYDAPTPKGGTNTNQGAIFVFGRKVGGDNNWELIKQFTVTDPQLPSGGLADRLGTVISFSDNRIAAVAIRDSDTYDTSNKFIYIFERDRGGLNQWGQVPGVRVSSLDFSSGFNYATTFEISGDTLVVGSPRESFQASPGGPSIQFQGAVYIYSRNQGGADQWGLPPNGRRYAPDGVFGDFFGRSVSISRNFIAVGADGRDLSATQDGAGMVYVLSRNEGGGDAWEFLPARLTASDAAAADGFGAFVKLRGDLLTVRASGDDVAGINNAGSVYLYDRSLGGGNAWGEVIGGKFSVDNVTGITKVKSPLYLSESHIAFATNPTVGNSSISIIRLLGSGVTTGGPGSVQFNSQGIISFTPNTAGTYQLRTSINLTTWANQDAPQTGLANTGLVWNTGIPGTENKRFFCIEKQ